MTGVALFVLLWLFSAKQRPTGAVSGLFLLGYGTFRFGVEYTREPDSFLPMSVIRSATQGQMERSFAAMARIGLRHGAMNC